VPFTLSHAAAALPLRRFNLVWSAFVIGTFAPDFEYFLRLAPESRYGHGFPGVFVFTLPTALAIFWTFHVVVKRPVVDLLPIGIQRRLIRHAQATQNRSARRFLMVLISVSSGIATHVLWDSVTHPQNWVYQLVPAADRSMIIPLIGSFSIFNLLDYGSSILGTAALGIWFLYWYTRTEPAPPSEAQFLKASSKVTVLLVMVTVAMIGATIRALAISRSHAHHVFPGLVLAYFVVTSIGLFLWQVVAYALMRNLRGHDRRRHPDSDPVRYGAAKKRLYPI
jgi:hypothetical protein